MRILREGIFILFGTDLSKSHIVGHYLRRYFLIIISLSPIVNTPVAFVPKCTTVELTLEIAVFLEHYKRAFPFRYLMKLDTLILSGIFTSICT